MRKVLASFLTVLVLCFALASSAFAATVVSPENPNTPVDPDPSSPQTGYAMSIGAVAGAAVLCGGVAIVCAKKAREQK